MVADPSRLDAPRPAPRTGRRWRLPLGPTAQRGATLVEAVVASGLLSIAVLGFVSGQMAVIDVQKRHENRLRLMTIERRLGQVAYDRFAPLAASSVNLPDRGNCRPCSEVPVVTIESGKPVTRCESIGEAFARDFSTVERPPSGAGRSLPNVRALDMRAIPSKDLAAARRPTRMERTLGRCRGGWVGRFRDLGATSSLYGCAAVIPVITTPKSYQAPDGQEAATGPDPEAAVLAGPPVSALAPLIWAASVVEETAQAATRPQIRRETAPLARRSPPPPLVSDYESFLRRSTIVAELNFTFMNLERGQPVTCTQLRRLPAEYRGLRVLHAVHLHDPTSRMGGSMTRKGGATGLLPTAKGGP